MQPGDVSKGLENEFETAVVNEPSVFEPLKFYCIKFQGNRPSGFGNNILTFFYIRGWQPSLSHVTSTEYINKLCLEAAYPI